MRSGVSAIGIDATSGGASGAGAGRSSTVFATGTNSSATGSRIANGNSPVNIFGEPYEVKAQVARHDAFSGHADRDELVSHVEACSGSMKDIYVVHGEEKSALAFGETLQSIKPEARVTVPKLKQKLDVLY